MIIIVCQACCTAVRISGDPDEMQSLFGQMEKYKCPQCDETMEEMEAIEPAALAALDVHDLEPGEAFSAFHGLGFPEEQECGALAVMKLFTEQTVKSVECHHLKGSSRSVIYNITFADGTKMYMGSSTFGATVYRIQKPHSYTEAVLREG